jgi:hypothetical protein
MFGSRGCDAFGNHGGAHLTTDAVEEQYEYECLHVNVSFGILHLWSQTRVLSYAQNQPGLYFKHHTNVAPVLVRTWFVSLHVHQHAADQSISSWSSRPC